MLTTLKNAFRIKDLRNKILFTFAMLVVIRLGSQLPVPGVDRHYFSNWFAQQTGDAFNFFDAFTGGSFLNMSILALNITPYITSSIIMQLLTIAIPKLEEMQKEGEDGRKKIASITRYVTVGLALVESTAMAITFGSSGLLENYNALNVITVIAALTAGSAFLMWVGERITEKGVGNGISIVLVINIISRIPQDIAQLFRQFVIGKATGNLSVLPNNRTWKLVFTAVEKTTIEAAADGIFLDAKVSYCSDTSCLTIEIPATSVEKEICITFPQGLSIAGPGIEERCYKVLEKAQIEYDLKASVLNNVKKLGKDAVASLAYMNLNPALLGELCEILTA